MPGRPQNRAARQIDRCWTGPARDRRRRASRLACLAPPTPSARCSSSGFSQWVTGRLRKTRVERCWIGSFGCPRRSVSANPWRPGSPSRCCSICVRPTRQRRRSLRRRGHRGVRTPVLNHPQPPDGEVIPHHQKALAAADQGLDLILAERRTNEVGPFVHGALSYCGFLEVAMLR
jgi:hypothetical protein